ncbi:MAG TPA: class I SAM-dependent methyltransferase, partial [Vicinamibacterales bacterium]|nr:class I SAM-dependent methyltransferase [Vicinamibacterales bacterium]
MSATVRADYGIDAPPVIRNLLIVGGVLLLTAAGAGVGLLPRVLELHPSAQSVVRFPLTFNLVFVGIAFVGTAAWMYFGSRYGKIPERDRLLDYVALSGSERVLDVGCGRGLLLVGAAKRLTTGSATGVDIWQAEDLSGNAADVPLRNAAIEGVADRVSVRTADMRALPFDAGAFDVVVSRAA